MDCIDGKKSSKGGLGGGVVAVGVDFVRSRGVSIAGTDDWDDSGSWGVLWGDRRAAVGTWGSPEDRTEYVRRGAAAFAPARDGLDNGVVVATGSASMGVASVVCIVGEFPVLRNWRRRSRQPSWSTDSSAKKTKTSSRKRGTEGLFFRNYLCNLIWRRCHELGTTKKENTHNTGPHIQATFSPSGSVDH